MDYLGIIKRAYEINLKHKFLWIFGMLAGGYGGIKSFNVGFPNSFDSSTFNSNSNTEGWEKIMGQALTEADLTAFWTQYSSLIIGGLVVLGVVAIVMFILNIISQGALVKGVEKISGGNSTNFYESFSFGSKQFWRVWGLAIIFLLLVLVSLCLWLIPASILLYTGATAAALIWGILLFFVCLVFWLFIGVLSPYSLRVVVLGKRGVWDSIGESLHFVRDHLVNVILMYLLLLALGIAFGIDSSTHALVRLFYINCFSCLIQDKSKL